jgi:putative transcriptional regulator
MTDASKPSAYPASGGSLVDRRGNRVFALGWVAFLVLGCAFWGVGESPCWGEEKPKNQLLFLVARSPVVDPFFERSVVLMLPLEGVPLIVGLIVNKPTNVPVLKLFRENPALKNREENAYMGGPVEMSAPSLVFHAPKPPKQAMLLYDDVYLSFDPGVISKTLQDSKPTGDFRLFLGRAQWAPEQLQVETLRGSWYSLRAEGEVIFDRDSEHLWKRLHDRARPAVTVENRISQPPEALLGPGGVAIRCKRPAVRIRDPRPTI